MRDEAKVGELLVLLLALPQHRLAARESAAQASLCSSLLQLAHSDRPRVSGSTSPSRPAPQGVSPPAPSASSINPLNKAPNMTSRTFTRAREPSQAASIRSVGSTAARDRDGHLMFGVGNEGDQVPIELVSVHTCDCISKQPP